MSTPLSESALRRLGEQIGLARVLADVQSEPAMSDIPLIRALSECVSNAFVLYLKAHAAHWNIEGPMFPELHAFFGALYEDVFDSIDRFAESMRQHKAMAPSTFAGILSSATIPDAGSPLGDALPLVQRLFDANVQMMESLKRLNGQAEAADDLGLANFVQERLGAHLKWDWQLRAFMRA